MRKIKWFFLLGLSAVLTMGIAGLTIWLVWMLPPSPGLSVPEQADAKTYAELALDLAQQGYYSEALGLNSRALEQNPTHPGLHYNQGWLAARQGQWPLALQHFNRVCELAPDHVAARVNRAWVYQQLGQPAQAQAELAWLKSQRLPASSVLETARTQQLLGQHQQAIESLNQVLEKTPERKDVYYWRSRSYLALEKWEQVVEDLNRLLATQPQAEWYRERAQAFLAQGKSQEALTDLQRSLVLEPTDAARLQKARILMPQDPQAVLDELSRLSVAESPEAESLKIQAWLALGQIRQASDHLDVLLKASPNQAVLWWLKARIARQQRKYADALQALDRAAQLGYRLSRLDAERALLAAQQGQREQALKYVEKALASEPGLITELKSERLLRRWL